MWWISKLSHVMISEIPDETFASCEAGEVYVSFVLMIGMNLQKSVLMEDDRRESGLIGENTGYGFVLSHSR